MNNNTTLPPAPAVSPRSSAERVEHALARIEGSRASLRAVLIPPEPPARAAHDDEPATGWSRRFADGWQHWRGALAEHPAVAVGMDAVQGWWKRQPLRPAFETAAGELRGTVTPLVRRHPVLAVALAATIGAALVAGRPWRWPAVSRHLADAPQRAGRWVVHQLTQAPVQSLIASLFLAWAAARKPADSSVPPAPEPAPAPAPRAAPVSAPDYERAAASG
jgi:hypothetical protein